MKLPFKNIKINKTWIVLGVALVVGLLAAMGARNYLSNQMAAIEARSKGESIDVVVAKRKLKRGELMSSDTVAVRGVPTEYAHSNALMPSQFDAFDGKSLAFEVNAGEVIMWSMIEGKKVPTFSARVEAGRRAITVSVDEINSISGLLEPGDMVDLMVTLTQKDKKLTFPLLQSVKVMATGQRSVDDPKSGERRQYSTITLDTTPEQAQNVIVAREAGKITALLRNPGDKQDFHNVSPELAKMLSPKTEPERIKPLEVALGVQQVPVLYGGRGGKLPPEGLQMGQHVQSHTVLTPPPAAVAESQMAVINPPAPAPVNAESANQAAPGSNPVRVLTAPSVRQP